MAKKPARKAPRRTRLMPANARELIVRMYRQGLGDCFLLAVPGEKPRDAKYILIDCGVHAREVEGPARLAQVMADLAAATGGQLDVVVGTHEHADHLSGFVQKGSPFLGNALKLRELWLAWTEKRGDRQADRLRRQHGTVQRIIDKAVEKAKAHPGSSGTPLAAKLETIIDFERTNHDGAAVDAALALIDAHDRKRPEAIGCLPMGRGNSLRPAKSVSAAVSKEKSRPSSNEVALGLLAVKAGTNNVTYGEPGDVLRVPGVRNLRAYVLGPPRNEDLLARDKPSKIRGATDDTPGGMYKEVYLSANTSNQAFGLSPGLGEVDGDSATPLPDDWRFPFARAFWRPFTTDSKGQVGWDPAVPAPAETKQFVESAYWNANHAWRRIDGDWLGAAEQLALNLVADTNNTSLVLAFEWGEPGSGATLLFPGDAQVGNWLSWRDQTYPAGEKKVSADDLLSRTILYKVGHHGSHNATCRRDPRETSETDALGVPFGLELMNDIVAMIPVDFAAASRNMPDPWKMPHEPLYRRLREKARRRVLRSDEELHPLDSRTDLQDAVPDDTGWRPVPGLKNVRWRRAQETFLKGTKGPLYYDVAISLRD